jgi:tripartite-type tricarboxylate transporter receptor subunit TctC
MKVAMRALAVVLLLGTGAAWAQYPDRPVRVLVGFPPGSSGDVIARLLAPKMSEGFGQQVIVENRSGGGSTIATEAVARSPADGHTALLSTIANTINPSLLPLPFDFEKDFAAVAELAETPGLLVAHPSEPGDIRDLVAAAKAWPGRLAYGSSGTGTVTHLWGELFNVVTDAKLRHIPYKGSSQAVTDLLAGRIALLFTPASSVVTQVKAQKLRALGVIGGRRLMALPNIPTMAEQGVPGFESPLWFGLNVPAGTPSAIIERLNVECVRALGLADLKTQFAAQSIEAAPSTSKEFEMLIRRETQKWAKVIQAAGVKGE